MSKHNKRYNAPTKRWGIPVKKDFWAPRSKPGKHPKDSSVPLVVIIRDLLGYAENSREARRIVGDRRIMVDGVKATDYNAPVGIMDIVSIPELQEHYRVMLDQYGKIRLVKIEGGEEKWKLCKIVNKTTINGGLTQYNLHDGRNIVLEDPNEHDTKDVLKLEIPQQLIIDSFKFKEGNMALIIGGKHIGELARIKEFEVVRSSKPNLVHFEEGITTIEDYVFVIGEETPAINIPEVGIV